MGQMAAQHAAEETGHDDGLAEGLIGRTEAGLEALMASPMGRAHEHLAATAEEGLLALLGHPPDGRDDWLLLARDLRGAMMRLEGLVEGSC